MGPTNPSSNIHERLRIAREQAGLSQGQAAKLLQWHRPTISEIEAGRRKVSTTELTRFAELYDVSIPWLMDDSPEKDPMVELAARELSSLKPEDLNKIMRLLRSLKKGRA